MGRNKSNPTIASRFSGSGGRSKLIESLLRQPLIGGDAVVSGKLAKLVEVVETRAGRKLTRQGLGDNDIFFILSGKVSVRVNGREIAVRESGEHVGEMALVDATALRSATVVAVERSVTAKLTEKQFTKLATVHQGIWRRVAVTLAQRLRERSRFHPAPRGQPVVFIGSSKEGLKIAKCMRDYLLCSPIVPRLWSCGVFGASRTAIEDLMKLTTEADFAIIVLTPDDITASRGTKKGSPRDNVLFELGLFMGALGRERTYIISPVGANIKIPTDLLGVTHLLYKRRGRGTLSHRLYSVKKQVRGLIEKHGPR